MTRNPEHQRLTGRATPTSPKKICPAVHLSSDLGEGRRHPGRSGSGLPLTSCVLWERLKNSLDLGAPPCTGGVAETYDILSISRKRKPQGEMFRTYCSLRSIPLLCILGASVLSSELLTMDGDYSPCL